jgi:hypothetical protein
LLIARAVAANAIGTEKARCAIQNLVAFFTLRACRTPVSAAIDVGFVAALLVIRTRKARMRFQIAKNAYRPAIIVRIAFDAIAFAIARFATTRRAGRPLCQGCLDLHARGTRGHVAIVGRCVVDIDGFFAADTVTLEFFAIAGNLRL